MFDETLRTGLREDFCSWSASSPTLCLSCITITSESQNYASKNPEGHRSTLIAALKVQTPLPLDQYSVCCTKTVCTSVYPNLNKHGIWMCLCSVHTSFIRSFVCLNCWFIELFKTFIKMSTWFLCLTERGDKEKCNIQLSAWNYSINTNRLHIFLLM